MGEDTYDVVVVGAGHNGLAAAVHLAKHGMSVCVLEQADRIGGAAVTEEVTLPGFRHDLYAMNLSLFAGSAFHAEYGNELSNYGLEFVPAKDCFASAFPSGKWLGLSADVETTAGRIEAFSADDAARWREMSAAFADDAPYYFALLGGPMGARNLARTTIKTLRRKGTAWTIDAVKLLLSSPRDFLDANFSSPELKAMLAPWAMHLDFPPDASGGALFPYLEAMADQSFGMTLGKGGAEVVPHAMAGLFTQADGVIHTSAPVASIEQTAGRATGVRLEDGDLITAREAVFASVTPKGLLSLLGGTTGAARKDEALKSFKHGPGTMMIHVAAGALPDWTAGEELKKFAYVHLAPTLSCLSTTYAHAMEGLLPAEPAVVVGQPTAVDPSRAPEGQHVLWIQVRVVPSHPVADALDEITPAPWDKIKEAMADRVMAIIERYAPGFGENVLARTVHSPADLEAANPNLVGGCSLGGSHHLRQNFLFRPAVGMAQYKTPIAGLWMIGSSTWPGAGLGAGSGYMAAKMLARN